MMLPIVKVPCLLVASVGLHVAVTPPQPPPNPNEKAPSTKLEGMLKIRTWPFTVKSIGWVVALAESAVILANAFPSSSLSQMILSKLVPLGTAQNIVPSPLFFVGASLTVMGGYLRYASYKALGPMFTYEMTIRKDHKLVTTGPYSVVRHPGYLGALLGPVCGMICTHVAPGSWLRESGIFDTAVGKGMVFTYLGLVCSVATGLVLRMSKEDDALHKLAGREWEEWAARVPYMILPWIY